MNEGKNKRDNCNYLSVLTMHESKVKWFNKLIITQFLPFSIFYEGGMIKMSKNIRRMSIV
jgi:hypothetical protein